MPENNRESPILPPEEDLETALKKHGIKPAAEAPQSQTKEQKIESLKPAAREIYLLNTGRQNILLADFEVPESLTPKGGKISNVKLGPYISELAGKGLLKISRRRGVRGLKYSYSFE